MTSQINRRQCHKCTNKVTSVFANKSDLPRLGDAVRVIAKLIVLDGSPLLKDIVNLEMLLYYSQKMQCTLKAIFK